LVVLLTGCQALDSSIRKYHQTAGQVKLGDSKDKALSILLPTQAKLPYDNRKTSDTYLEGDDVMEIYYFRSGRQPDNLTTDDEFTPYVFKNGTLIAIGWKTLGGPKTHGQVIPPAPVTNIEHNVTIEKD
jgi:hypothetical protein